jgi:hypothetical protein
MLLAAIHIVETVLGDPYAKELREISPAGNTVRRRISDILEDLCDRSI